jgi:hypothetical protein
MISNSSSMTRHVVWLFVSFIALCTMAQAALAHVPLGAGENDSLERATSVENPTKSWAIYGDIDRAGQARYFKLQMNNGERLYASLFLSQSGAFSPGMVVMGPGLVTEGTPPSFVEIPHGDSFIVFEGSKDGRDYEPFTPAAYYQTCRVDIELNRSGTYYITVFDSNHTGDFGLAIGYVESFTIVEWLMVPFDVINIHLWEGQSPLLIFGPLIMTVLLVPSGLYIAKRRGARIPPTISFGLVTVAASLCIGTGMMTALQMGMALSISNGQSMAGGLMTAIFVSIPLVIGVMMIRLSMSGNWVPVTRVKLAIFGMIGMVFWAGLLAGPVIALMVAMLPKGVLGRSLFDRKRHV